LISDIFKKEKDIVLTLKDNKDTNIMEEVQAFSKGFVRNTINYYMDGVYRLKNVLSGVQEVVKRKSKDTREPLKEEQATDITNYAGLAEVIRFRAHPSQRKWSIMQKYRSMIPWSKKRVCLVWWSI
jgi:hypothetical protein